MGDARKKVVVIDPKNGNRNEADCKTDKFGGYGQQSSETTSKRKISDGWHKQFKNQQCHNNSDHPIAKGFNPGCTFNASRNSLLHMPGRTLAFSPRLPANRFAILEGGFLNPPAPGP
jgi:hypothetical protein